MNRKSARFAITGLGVVSPIGIGDTRFRENLIEAKTGAAPVSTFSTDELSSHLAFAVSDFQPAEILGKKGLRLLDRTTLLALCASKFALDDSGISLSDDNETGVVIGTTAGSLESRKAFFWEALRNGPRAVNPALFPNTVVNSPASQVAIRFNLRGVNSTVSTGMTSSLEAINYATRLLECKKAKAILVGGIEELCEISYLGASKAGLLSTQYGKRGEICAPFDRARNGTIFGEGAAMFVVETMEDAKARGARIFAEYRGGASSIDRSAYNRYSIRGEGAKRAIRKTLDRAKVSPGDIDYISSGANGNLIGDAAEARALRACLGKDNSSLRVTATKAAIGETFSASGAFQLAAVLVGMQNDIIPPTANLEIADSRCPIECVSGEARAERANHILISSVSPMCHNAACVISRFDD